MKREVIENIKKFVSEEEFASLDMHSLAKLAARRYTLHEWKKGRKVVYKSTLKRKFGYEPQNIVKFYHEIGLVHVQEAREMREKLLRSTIEKLLKHLEITYIIPQGGHITPDIIAYINGTKLAIELKAYRDYYYTGELEILQAYKYYRVFKKAWLITTSERIARYKGAVRLKDIIERGRRRYTELIKTIKKKSSLDNEDLYGIYKKGLETFRTLKISNKSIYRQKIRFFSGSTLIESIRGGREIKNGIALSNGPELLEILENEGIDIYDIRTVMHTPLEKLMIIINKTGVEG